MVVALLYSLHATSQINTMAVPPPTLNSLHSTLPRVSLPYTKSLQQSSQSPSILYPLLSRSTTQSFTSVNLRTNTSRLAMGASASTTYSADISDTLGDVTIYRASGEPVLFKDLWDQSEGIAVVALLRHFGCPCCWEFASALKEAKERFDSAGVKLIAVGVGTPSKARMLAERLPFPIDCLYADPDRKAYEVLSLYYGVGRTFFNPASAKVFTRFGALREATKNYTIEATPDDRSGVLQQGGMFVFKGKELLYARKDEATGDHASLDDVLEKCCKVPAA